MDFGRYLAIAITIITFMFGLWVLLQVLGVVTTSLNTATNQIVATTATVPKTIYAFQPTNPSISSTNTKGYLIQLPQCYISSNPYGGATGTYGLPSCVALKYGAVSIVVWFYVPSTSTQGVILGMQSSQYTGSPATWVPALYIGTNGKLRFGEWSSSSGIQTLATSISPGWHMAVWEEGGISSSGATLYGYLDGNLVGTLSLSGLAFTVGGVSPPPAYWDIGTGFAAGAWPNGNGGWFFFNGIIAYVAIYNTVLSQSQVQALYQAGFPNTLFSQNLVVAYLLIPNYYNGGGYYFVPYYTNTAILNQLGISNATAISITPSGSVGAIPSSQFVPFKGLITGGTVYTINNATGMDANKIFTPAINYAQSFASFFALVLIIGLVVGFIWTRRR